MTQCLQCGNEKAVIINGWCQTCLNVKTLQEQFAQAKRLLRESCTCGHFGQCDRCKEVDKFLADEQGGEGA